MHLAMITAYFIEHMFGFSQKQKAGLINKPAFSDTYFWLI